MEQELSYTILVDKYLILEYYKGKHTVDELIAFKKVVAADKNYNPNYNVIHDFREIEFMLGPNEVKKYIQMLQNDSKFVGHRKSAMITNTPNQVVTTTAFDLLKKGLPISVKICSTLETAFAFVDIETNEFNFILNEFNKLSKTILY